LLEGPALHEKAIMKLHILIMKTLFLTLVALFLLPMPIWAADTYSWVSTNASVFPTNCIEFAVKVETNFVVFGPPYGTNPPANIPEMLKTNGLECFVMLDGVPLKPLVYRVYLVNHTTNYIYCLRMPAMDLFRIALLDREGRQVEKTALGKKYGLPLSQEQIDDWRLHWGNSRLSPWMLILPAGLKSKDPTGKMVQHIDDPTDICFLGLNALFEIKEAGDYELHLQMRFIQSGDNSGELHYALAGKLQYPITWLPEVAVKVHIRPEDISK
jgi:hypothetical protein